MDVALWRMTQSQRMSQLVSEATNPSTHRRLHHVLAEHTQYVVLRKQRYAAAASDRLTRRFHVDINNEDVVRIVEPRRGITHRVKPEIQRRVVSSAICGKPTGFVARTKDLHYWFVQLEGLPV